MYRAERTLTALRVEQYPEYRWLALLLPLAYLISPKFGMGGLSFRAGAWVLASCIFLILLPVAYERVFTPRLLDKAFAFIGVSMALSFGAATVMSPGSVGLRDLFEFPKVFLFWCIYRIAVTVVWERRHLIRLAWVGIIASTFASIVAMLQSMERFGVNEWLTPWYASSWHIYKMRTIGRVVGVFENPNYFGLFLAFILMGVLIVLSKLVMAWPDRKQHRATFVFGGAWLLLVMVAFSLAASRTALLALVLAFPVLVLMFVLKHPSGPQRQLAAKGIAVALLVILAMGSAALLIGRNLPKEQGVRSMDLMTRVEIGMQQLAGDLPSSTSSLDERLIRWSVAVDRFTERPVLGWGPAKYSDEAQDRPPTDNEYLVYMERYGFVGLIAYVLLFYGLAREAFRTARRIPIEKGLFTAHDLALLNLGIAVVLVFFNLMAGTYYNLHLFPVVLFLHGFMVSLSWEG